MKTIYDWASVLLFCAIAFTYLQRSMAPPPRPDRPLDYLPAAAGCALANWLGNEGQGIAAAVTLAATAAYYILRLHPFKHS